MEFCHKMLYHTVITSMLDDQLISCQLLEILLVQDTRRLARSIIVGQLGSCLEAQLVITS